MLTAFYGLRRSEVVGLKWAAVDFEQNTIEICHTVTTVRLDGKEVLVESNGTKPNPASAPCRLYRFSGNGCWPCRRNRKKTASCAVGATTKIRRLHLRRRNGQSAQPDYLSNSFQVTLQNYHLRRIRFHDLRHSCASLLLANGVPMKMIQEWLGHSDFSTTANIYSHLDYASKVSSAEVMLNGLGMGSNLKMTLKKCDFSQKQGVFSPVMKLSNSKFRFCRKTVQSAQKARCTVDWRRASEI